MPRHYISRSIGVTSLEEAREANEDMRRHGITAAEYLTEDRVIDGRRVPAGTFVATDRSARTAEFKRRGFFDRDAGYGDYAGR